MHQMTSAEAILLGAGGRDAAGTQLPPGSLPHGHPRGGCPSNLSEHLGSTPQTQAARRDKAWKSAHLHSSPSQLLISEMSTPLGTCKSSPRASQFIRAEVVSLFFVHFKLAV